MTNLTRVLAVCTLAAAVGCNQGTSTAPGTSKSTGTAAEDTKRELTVSVREAQVITQDTTDEVTVMIDRDNIADPVELSFENLPKGVSVVTENLAIPADKSSLDVTFKADPDAATTTDHPVKVSAKAKGQSDMQPATTEFKLTVKAK